MRSIIELIIAVFDLFEAEVRQLQQKSRSLFIGFGLVLVAAFLSSLGLGLMLGALFYALMAAVGLSLGWTSLITGCVSLGMGVGIVCIARGVLTR
ncbi:MAG: hypothetical protein U5L00_09300 [Desulfovermiculus sp.]|nr:hypothetical protein [Desulfovermiculus sp.]